MPNLIRLAHIIVSQGHHRHFFGKYSFQPWVENVNKLLKAHGFKIVVLSSGECNAVYYSSSGEKRIIIHKKLGALQDYFSILIPFKALFSVKPNLIVIHGLQHLLTLSSLFIYGILKRVPILTIVHGLYGYQNPIALLRDIAIKLLLRLIERTHVHIKLLSLTDYDKNCLIKRWGASATQIIVSLFPLYMSIDEIKELAKSREFSKSSETKNVFLYLGRISPEKRIHKIILAFHELLKKGYEAQLLIIGNGPSKRELADLVKTLNFSGNVETPGIARGGYKWGYYNRSNALVLASKQEGFPRVVIEAFCSGKPVIAPNIPGLSEIIKRNKNGFLFETEEDLVNSMIEVIKKPELCRTIGIANENLILKHMVIETNGFNEFAQLIKAVFH